MTSKSDGPYRQLFISLLLELKKMSDFADFRLQVNFLEDNLQVLDSLSAYFTALLQKDTKHNRPDEQNG